MSTHDQKNLMAASTNKKLGQIVTTLDLGCSKIVCLIGRTVAPSEGGVELLGVGEQTSRGLKNGVVIDLDGLERSVRLAVEDAERMANVQASNVRLGVSGPYMTTKRILGKLDLNGREIGQKDVHKLLEVTFQNAVDEKHHILHAVPLSYGIDGNEGVRDPRGMYASELQVAMNLVLMPLPVYRNIVLSVSRAHLGIESSSAGSFASANAVLTDDELDNGAICIDLGAGSTGVTVFMEGSMAFSTSISSGSSHVSSDLAYGIGTTVAAAERIKTLHGSVLPPSSGPKQFIEAPKIGDDGRLTAGRMPKEDLYPFIAPRVEEIFDEVSKALSKSGFGTRLPRRAVLTGGGSDLTGIRELAAKRLSMPTRLGRPLHADHLGENCQRPAFSTAVGLLSLPNMGPKAPHVSSVKSKNPSASEGNVIGKAFEWFRENI